MFVTVQACQGIRVEGSKCVFGGLEGTGEGRFYVSYYLFSVSYCIHLFLCSLQTTPTVHGLWAKSLANSEADVDGSTGAVTSLPEGFDREGTEAFRATSLDAADCVFATEWL